MNKRLQDFMYITKRGRNGTLVLCILAICILIFPEIYKRLSPETVYIFPDNPSEQNPPKPMENTASTINTFVNLSPTIIDPNTATKDHFIQVGLSKKQANTILNYRNKGGKFFNTNDLKKIYGLDENTFEKIKPFIKINTTKRTEKTTNNKPDFETKSDIESTPAKPVIITAPAKKFDPNTINADDLLAMGLPEKIINTMMNFRNKGGKFYKPEDLQLIYGMKEEWYKKLESSIEISNTKNQSKQKNQPTTLKTPTPNKEKSIARVDVNTATIEDFKQLRGIGPYYARKIVNFRDKLGGFTDIDQIGSTYNLPDSVFQKIKPFLDHSPIFQKININTATDKILAAHPFINRKQAGLIIKYRKEHGAYQSMKDLRKIRAFKADFLERIAPYLSFGER